MRWKLSFLVMGLLLYSLAKPVESSGFMLSQMQRLTMATEGRYATDEELRFLPEYVRSYELRMQTYQQLQKNEATILKYVLAQSMQKAPDLFPADNPQQLRRCQQDVMQTFRYLAAVVLTNDVDVLRERYLLWLQTIVRSFDKQRSNDVVYTVMQEACQKVLPAPQAELILPLIQEVHLVLSEVS